MQCIPLAELWEPGSNANIRTILGCVTVLNIQVYLCSLWKSLVKFSEPALTIFLISKRVRACYSRRQADRLVAVPTDAASAIARAVARAVTVN